jgi:hypothetical protein
VRGATRAGIPPALPAPVQRPAFGLTEDNAQLLLPPGAAQAAGGAGFEAARGRLTALHPRYVRLLIDWAALQPQRDRPPDLAAADDGCARQVGPCAGYLGVSAELAALAAQQRAAREEGRPGFEVVLDLLGVPAWAAAAPSGCETPGTRPFSRPLSPAGLAAYRSLIESLLALGRRERVPLTWWSPWNEPNNPQFLSPQRASCQRDAPTRAPAEYTQLAEAMASALDAAGGEHHMLLGELAAYPSDSVHRTSAASFVAALPGPVLCRAGAWAIHVYAGWGERSREADPVAGLERALDARGSCSSDAPIWVTEAGAGGPRPGGPRVPGARAERLACQALAAQLEGWLRDARVAAILQYSFREDPAYPVGLLSAGLAHVYSTYGLWLDVAREEASGSAAPSPASACA